MLINGASVHIPKGTVQFRGLPGTDTTPGSIDGWAPGIA